MGKTKYTEMGVTAELDFYFSVDGDTWYNIDDEVCDVADELYCILPIATVRDVLRCLCY